MNRKVLATAVGGLALGAMALPAAAQTSKPIGLSIRAGIDFPTTSNSTTLWGAGLEFNLGSAASAGMGMGGHLSISGDWIGKDNLSLIPVLINFVGTTSSPVYYTVGAGMAFKDFPGDHVWDFAYRLGVGYNFSQSTTPLFLEANFFGNSNSNLNVIGVYVGIRL